MLLKNYRGGEKWLNGVVREVLGPVTYSVEVKGKCVKRHVNQILGVKGNPNHSTQMDSCDSHNIYDFNVDTDSSDRRPLEPPRQWWNGILVL